MVFCVFWGVSQTNILSSPGRFMAADEVRLLLAYTLWHYDIALEDGSTRPKNMTFNRFCFPDMSASITLTARD